MKKKNFGITLPALAILALCAVAARPIKEKIPGRFLAGSSFLNRGGLAPKKHVEIRRFGEMPIEEVIKNSACIDNFNSSEKVGYNASKGLKLSAYSYEILDLESTDSFTLYFENQDGENVEDAEVVIECGHLPGHSAV